jgi:alpha-glucosidase (family GH31 glycosyl hydrolase)
MLPPFWSLGLHHSSTSYVALSNAEESVDLYDNNEIPLESMWLNLDYTIGNGPFSVNEERYKIRGIQDLASKKEVRLLTTLAMHVSTIGGNPAAMNALRYQVLLNSPYQNYKTLQVHTFGNRMNIADVFSPNFRDFWYNQLTLFHNTLPFSGAWLDMNEPSSTCDGDCDVLNPFYGKLSGL